MEINGKLSYLFIPTKTSTLVPEFVEEDLPLVRTTAMIPAFTEENLPWALHTDDAIKIN